MSHKRIMSFFGAALLALSFSLTAADKIAIAEPVLRSGIKAAEVDAVWDMMESAFQSEEYELISRASLKSMLTEIGLTAASDLLDLKSEQQAAMGKIQGVKYILVPTLSKLGTQYNFLLKVVDASTGKVDQRRSASLRFKNMDELADKLEPTLMQALSDKKNSGLTALLNPVVRCRVPANFNENLSSCMESTLISNGVALQNLSSVERIFKENNLGSMSELEPKMYVKVGKLLEVDYLIYNVITRFEIRTTERHIAASNRTVRNTTGKIAGTIYVISAKTGQKAAVIPMDTSVNFKKIGEDTSDWTEEDYERFMAFNCISPNAIAKILQIPRISGIEADRQL